MAEAGLLSALGVFPVLAVQARATTSVAAPAAPAGPEGAPVLPPAEICGDTALLAGPKRPPPGAVRVPPGDNSVSLAENWHIQPRTVYWFAPGIHTLGTGQYGQVEAKYGDKFLGAPGAVLDGQGVNQSAFTGTATDVSVEHLTIEHFVPPGGQYVVNHNMGRYWTVAYNTVEDNGYTEGSKLGAAMGLGSGDVVEYNCLTRNGEYGLNAGGDDTVFAHNEVSWNGLSYFPDDDCGCSGGIKYWATTDAVVEDNYIHDNYNVGLWFDTDNAGALVQGNYISQNWAEGLIYEISYNAEIAYNSFADNGWGNGSSDAGGFPYGDAIYISSSGGDSEVPSRYSGSLLVTGNVLTDNWDGIIVYQNPNRMCGSLANTSTGYCTLDDPSVFTTTSCPEHDATGLPAELPDYFDGCQWKSQHVEVTGNQFDFDPATIRSTVPSLPGEVTSRCPASHFASTATSNAYWCGFNGMFSIPGSGTGGPSRGWAVVDAIMNLQGPTGELPYDNYWTDNCYSGPWTFQAAAQGASPVQTDLYRHGVASTVDFAQWRDIWHQDPGSSFDPVPAPAPWSSGPSTACQLLHVRSDNPTGGGPDCITAAEGCS